MVALRRARRAACWPPNADPAGWLVRVMFVLLVMLTAAGSAGAATRLPRASER
jgi:hypothetical protein